MSTDVRSIFSRHDVLLKEQLAARGFVSDVTVKRREEALIVSYLSFILFLRKSVLRVSDKVVLKSASTVTVTS